MHDSINANTIPTNILVILLASDTRQTNGIVTKGVTNTASHNIFPIIFIP